MADVIRMSVAGVEVSLCPDQHTVVRERLLGRVVMGPKYIAALDLVNKVFPGSRVIEVKKYE